MLKKTCLDGVSYWSRPQLDRGIDFNGFLWARPDGNVLVDPMELDEGELSVVRDQGGARWIVLTNFDHLRAAPALKEALGAEVLAPAQERERFAADASLVDRWFEDAGDLPDALRGGLDVFLLRGGKSPVEAALFLRGPDALLFGDLVRSHASGRLCLLPDAKVADRRAVLDSLRPLRDLPARAVLLGDGDSLFRDGAGALRELLAELDR